MNEVVLEAKAYNEAINKAMTALNASENEIVYSIEEIKGKLFKSASYKITATTVINVAESIKQYLEVIVKNLGLEVKFESNVREKNINIFMYSDNNAILIGKDGQTLKSLEILSKQYIYNKYNCHIKLNLDVENYKEKRIKNIEYLAKKTAREVRISKVEATLENMNSFERRIVHNVLTDFKGVTTISEGEEPKRHVIIKPTD